MKPTTMMPAESPEKMGAPDVPMGAEQDQEDAPNVSPEEQKIYDTVMAMALNMMYGKGATDTIMQKLGAGKDNIAGTIGHTAAMIMRSVTATAEKKGKTIPDDVIFAAGQEVVSDLVQLAVNGRLMKAEAFDSVAEAAFTEGLRIWGKQMQDSGKLTPEIQQQAQADLKEAGIQWQDPKGQQAPAGQPPAPPPAGVVNEAMGAQ